MPIQRIKQITLTAYKRLRARISSRGFLLGLFVLFSLEKPLHAELISIAEYNQQRQSAKKAEYDKFKLEWFAFLRKNSNARPKSINAAWARSATEEFLIESGGLKARLALASQKNQFAMTFTRPVEESHRVAGFHRTRRSIFMDINQMTSNDWLIVFIHEVAHSLDSELVDSLEQYNDFNYIDELIRLGAKNTSFSELNDSERQKLDSWLMAGLNRGFLSEYRAWLLTYLIYEEGIKDGTLTEVNWLQALKQNKPVEMKTTYYILRYLSPSWKDPVGGQVAYGKINPFAYDYVKAALKELRIKIDENPEIVKLGQIGHIISNEFDR